MTPTGWTLTSLAVTMALLACGAGANAAGPHPLGDLHPGPGGGSSYPSGWIETGDRTFFLATHTGIGREFYATDGTPEGTRLLADSQPGDSTAELWPIGVADDRLFWWAPDLPAQLPGLNSLGTLWVSDGTPEGTMSILPSGVWMPDPQFAPDASVFVGGGLWFVACDPQDCSLWRSDGSPEGTTAMHPLPRPGLGEHAAEEIAAVHDRIVFTADGALWTLEPGGGATVLLSSSDPFDRPRGLEAIGDRLLFVARTDSDEDELWASDGTPQGTQPISSFPEERQFATWRRVVGSHLYLQVNEGGNEGYEIWRSDGTPEGTGPVTAVDLPSELNFLSDQQVAFAGERVFVIATNLESGTAAVWVSDGTPESTREVLDCEEDCPPLLSSLGSAGDRVLFIVEVDQRVELWSSDGTADDTGRIATLCSHVCQVDERFSTSGENAGIVADGRVWISDGTAAGTRPINPPDLPAQQAGTFETANVGRVGECWLFSAFDHRGYEPWCSEGTVQSTRLLEDIDRTAPSSEPAEIIAVGDRAVFSAVDDAFVRQVWSSDGRQGSARALTGSTFHFPPESRALAGGGGFALFHEVNVDAFLWRTDGTLNGTWPVGNVHRSGSVAFDGSIYAFGYTDDQSGIWRIDGTPDGLRLAVPLASSELPSAHPVVLGPAFYYPYRGLWRSDGTPEGTWRVAGDLPSDAGFPSPFAITELAGHVYFIVDYQGPGQDELWRTDGSPDSAQRVAVIPEFVASHGSKDGGLHAHHGALYFTAVTFEPLTGRSGGTVLRFAPGEGLSVLTNIGGFPAGPGFEAMGDDLFFSFDDGIHGAELWRSDGTPNGTRLAADLHGGGSSHPQYLTPAGDRLFFSAGSDRHGRELWVVEPDGEVRLVSDLFPGAFSSDPRDLTVAGDTLFFSADDGETGREPWALPLDEIGPTPPPPGPFLTSPSVPGFRFKVRITSQGGTGLAGRQEPDCIPETLCVSGALAGRSEVFLRVVGPKPNGRLWPTLVKFSTSRVEVWVEQVATGQTRYYDLAGAAPGFDLLPGLFDRQGFAPIAAATTPAPLVTRIGGAMAPSAAGTDERLTSPALPGFTFRVEITDQSGQTREARIESDCIEETVCLSGALPGRSELFLRVVGPKPNGRLWPTLVRFSTSTIDVWLTQTSTGQERHYRLEGASPGSTDLSGLFDRDGFQP